MYIHMSGGGVVLSLCFHLLGIFSLTTGWTWGYGSVAASQVIGSRMIYFPLTALSVHIWISNII